MQQKLKIFLMFSSNWVITKCEGFNLESSGLDFFIISSSSSGIMMQFEMIGLQSPPACGSECEHLCSDVHSVFSVFSPSVLQLCTFLIYCVALPARSPRRH